MDKIAIEDRIERLRWAGYNPIHLWKNIYLVRKYPTWYSDWPVYKVEFFKK